LEGRLRRSDELEERESLDIRERLGLAVREYGMVT
jgi:hypothetical protein